MTLGPAPSPVEVDEPVDDVVTDPDTPWIVIVWNDPINLMTYVTFVLQKLFGYPREKADRLMMQVHEEGRAVVANGSRETGRAARVPAARARSVGHDAARPLMGFLRRSRIERRRPRAGTRSALPKPERQLLRDLVDQLRDVLLATTEDPSLRRLFPTAYHDDPDRDREYQHARCATSCSTGAWPRSTLVEETVATERLDQEQADRLDGARSTTSASCSAPGSTSTRTTRGRPRRSGRARPRRVPLPRHAPGRGRGRAASPSLPPPSEPDV